MKILQSVVLTFLVFNSFSQTYDSYFGKGNKVGVKVSSSSSNINNPIENTLTGTGYLPDESAAVRFLHQAGFGANLEDVNHLTNMGIESWIDEQIDMPTHSMMTAYNNILTSFGITDPDPIALKSRNFLSFMFYDQMMKNPDQLRQKVAFALSQIFVVSYESAIIERSTSGIASFYDMLYQGAFGNYRDMLFNLSVHPIMGGYLSHFQNSKEDLVAGVLPDENFAREIMQLFSIGLYELNNDGTHKKDELGNSISTYDIFDVQEMSKVFTGLGGNSFSSIYLVVDKKNPMQIHDLFHDKTEKKLLNGTVLQPNKSGMEDLNKTIDMLYNHSNIGPFMAIRLIQQLVKSNPSPAYINRVATVFNDNGKGVRGDMAAVVKAILMDPEARDCSLIQQADAGKLLQPIERYTILLKAFKVSTPSGKFYLGDMYQTKYNLQQAFMAAPTVFNFFSPFYAEPQVVEPNGLVSPGFQIFNSITSINYYNFFEDKINNTPFENLTSSIAEENPQDVPSWNFSDEENIYNTQGTAALLNHLNLLLCRNQLSEYAQAVIENTINQYKNNINNYSAQDAVKDAIYFVIASPDFAVLN